MLGNISNNVNPIARRANGYGEVYATELDEIQHRQDEIWEQQRTILRKLGNILDAVK